MMTVHNLVYHIFRIPVLTFMNVIGMELPFLVYSLFCFDTRVILSLNYDVEIILGCFCILWEDLCTTDIICSLNILVYVSLSCLEPSE